LTLAKRYLSNGERPVTNKSRVETTFQINTNMRIHEIAKIKPIQPLTPSAARINALKQAKDRAADALTAERDRQKQVKAVERVRTAQQALAKARMR